MADFRRWILALAVVALLAGLTVPASAQSAATCNSNPAATPLIRAEGLTELVGDLVLYCTGGTPTQPGNPVPTVNITVMLNTNITSKVLGTQLSAFGNGQTSAMNEALLLIDEPNSPASPGEQCTPGGNFYNPATNDFCPGFKAGYDPGVTGSFGSTANPYPILNCGAVVGGTLAAPDGGQSGPGVCQIYATPYPEHTYDGTISGTPGATVPAGLPLVPPATGVLGDFGPCAAAAVVTAPGTIAAQPVIVAGQTVVTFPLSTNISTIHGIPFGQIVTSNIPGAIALNTTVVSVSNSGSTTVAPSITLSIAATVSSNVVVLTFTAPATQTTTGVPTYGCGRPNVFQGRVGATQNPNQYNAVTFWGVPFDPPGSTFTRVMRITNIRANAAQLGISSTYTTQAILMSVAVNNSTTMTLSTSQQIVGYVNRGLTVSISPTTGNYNSSILGLLNANQSGYATNLIGAGTRTGVAPNVPVINEFVQCESQNGDLFLSTPAPGFRIPAYLGASPIDSTSNNLPGGYNCNTAAITGGNSLATNGDCPVGLADATPWIRFSEGFASSWKVKNLSHIVGDALGASTSAGNSTLGTQANPLVTQGPSSFPCDGDYCYNGKRNNQADIPQNVPGAAYNTESGFTYGALCPTAGVPCSPNPPTGFGFGYQVPNQGNPFSDDWSGTSNATGISGAGVANQGTRLYLSFTNIPNGSSLWVSPVIYLFRQGVVHNGDPASLYGNANTTNCNGVQQCQSTGVMVLTSTDGSGSGAFAASAGITAPFQLQKVGSTGLVVYEILATDTTANEYADVPVVLSYASNPGQNLPAPAPPNPNTQATGGFAPFYTSAASQQPSPNANFQAPTLPVPRFVPGQAFDFINIQKCSCNILFPFVANQLGYDTGIAFANTSLDPGGTYGFGIAQPQAGTVEFWYYGDMQGNAAAPGPQISSAVQPGHVLTYVLSSGSAQYGLDARGAGLIGYIIAQSQFQYCHAYAFISAQGAGPTSPGTSEGYLGIVLDDPGLHRTIAPGENKAH